MPPPTESQFPKRCATCERVHRERDWERLQPKGYQTDDVEKLELRNCQCGSTLAVVVEVFKIEEAA